MSLIVFCSLLSTAPVSQREAVSRLRKADLMTEPDATDTTPLRHDGSDSYFCKDSEQLPSFHPLSGCARLWSAFKRFVTSLCCA